MNETDNNAPKEKVYVTALFYLKEDGHEKFTEYKTKVGKVFAKHNGYVTKKIKPIKLVKGTMELPDEIHFGYFESMDDLVAAGDDKAYQNLIKNLRTPSLKNLVVILSKQAIFDVPLETGDETKFYGITLLNYNQNNGSENMFNEYLTKSCAIMAEFGAHFEHFQVPFEVKGDFEKPDKVHLFYMDDMEGFGQLGADLKMQELSPLRDKSLKKIDLILGRAID